MAELRKEVVDAAVQEARREMADSITTQAAAVWLYGGLRKAGLSKEEIVGLLESPELLKRVAETVRVWFKEHPSANVTVTAKWPLTSDDRFDEPKDAPRS